MRGKHRLLRLLNSATYYLSGFVPRRRNLFVFGAWHGERYADNSKYLVEYLAFSAAPVELVWCGHERLRESVKQRGIGFVRRDSLRAYWTLARAGTCFVSHGPGDLASLTVLRRCRRVNLGHGIAIKNMGAPPPLPASPRREFLRALRRRPWAHEYWSASSPVHAEKLIAENENEAIEPDRILETGQPRLDPLIAMRSDPRRRVPLRNHLRDRHGIPPDAPLVLYLPTFRDSGQSAFSFSELGQDDEVALAEVLQRRGAWLAERSHFADTDRLPDADAIARIVDLSTEMELDTQELLGASDVLITDYSGCYIDFLLLDRPVIHFAYDYAVYRDRDRGLYFDLEDVAGGPIVSDVAALGRAIDDALAHPDRDAAQRLELRRRLLTWEDGHASERTADVLGFGPRTR